MYSAIEDNLCARTPYLHVAIECIHLQAIPTMEGEPQVFKYLFMQPGSTKSWTDAKAVTDRIADIRRADERSASAACMVAGDEETFRFMCHLIRSNPTQFHWLRIHVGDWHLLYHMAKAIMARFWGAGVEHIAEALDIDGSKASEAGNYRTAHHTISIFLEAMWATTMAMYYSKVDPCFETAQAAADAAAEAPRATAAPVPRRAGASVRPLGAAANSPAPSAPPTEVQPKGTAAASPLHNGNRAGPALGIRPAVPR